MVFLGLSESITESAEIDPRLVKDMETHDVLRANDPNAVAMLHYISSREGQPLTGREISDATGLDRYTVYNFLVKTVARATRKAPDFFSFTLTEEAPHSQTCRYTRQTPAPNQEELIKAISSCEKMDRKNLCVAFLILHGAIGQSMTLKEIISFFPGEVKESTMRKALKSLAKLLEASEFIPFRVESQGSYPCRYTVRQDSETQVEDVRDFLPYLILKTESTMRIHQYFMDHEDQDLDLHDTARIFGMDDEAFQNKCRSLAKIQKQIPLASSHLISGKASRLTKTLTFKFKTEEPLEYCDSISFIHKTPSTIPADESISDWARTFSNIGTVPFDNTPRAQHEYLLQNSTWALYRETFQNAVAACLQEYAYEGLAVHTRQLALDIAVRCHTTIDQAMLAMKTVEAKMENFALELGLVVARQGTYWTMFFLDPIKRVEAIAKEYSILFERECWDVWFFDPAIPSAADVTYRKVYRLKKSGKISETDARILNCISNAQGKGSQLTSADIMKKCGCSESEIKDSKNRLFDERFSNCVYFRARSAGWGFGHEVTVLKKEVAFRSTSLKDGLETEINWPHDGYQDLANMC